MPANNDFEGCDGRVCDRSRRAAGRGCAAASGGRRGRGGLVDDYALPGMAFGHVLRSPHAHAKIKSIDISKAKAAPGVLCVLTGDDWIKSGWGDLPVPV